MRVNRRFLYWGVVLLAIGGVLVVADLTAVDTDHAHRPRAPLAARDRRDRDQPAPRRTRVALPAMLVGRA